LIGSVATQSPPVASVALILGIHRLMSQGLTPTNFLGNAVATIVMAKWEGALDEARMHRVLDERALERDLGSIAPASP
jgi:aerobic C4-dicarboxylate transport protein